MINIANNLGRNVALFPDKTAIHFGKQQLSYAQLDAAASQLANGLRGLGIGKGDKVALSCPNLPYFPIAYYAILKLGAIVVPLNILLKAPEIAYHLRDSDARVFLCFEGSAELPMGAGGLGGVRAGGQLRALLPDARRRGAAGAARRLPGSRPADARPADQREHRADRSPTTPRSSCTPRAPPARRRAPSCRMPTWR